jgi:hypothetical protein
MADFELTLDFFSRFKDTELQQKDGKVFFGRWTPPTIELDGDEAKVTITEENRGTLDFIAERELGTREAAWIIALVNGIEHIPTEVVPGLTLTIPKRENVQRALQKEDNRG